MLVSLIAGVMEQVTLPCFQSIDKNQYAK